MCAGWDPTRGRGWVDLQSACNAAVADSARSKGRVDRSGGDGGGADRSGGWGGGGEAHGGGDGTDRTRGWEGGGWGGGGGWEGGDPSDRSRGWEGGGGWGWHGWEGGGGCGWEGGRWMDSEGGRSSAWGGGRSSAWEGSPSAEPAPATAAGKGSPPPPLPAREEQGAVAPFAGVHRDPAPIFKLEFFENFGRDWSGNYKQHNAALKFFRDEYEDRENPYGSRAPVFVGAAVAEEISKILKFRAHGKAQDNRDWDWDHSVKVPWSWMEMVAQMDGPTMLHVVRGHDKDRSRGLVRCECRP